MVDYKISYVPIMYSAAIDERPFFPQAHGLYILYKAGNIYCGSGKCLSTRIVDSRRFRGFGDQIFYFPGNHAFMNDEPYSLHYIKKLEETCTAALHMITFYNALPIDLRNVANAKPLFKSGADESILEYFQLKRFGFKLIHILQHEGSSSTLRE